MFKHVLSLSKQAVPRKLSARFASQFGREIISYDDPAWFPPEEGLVQKSPYGGTIEIPRCRLDQLVWANSGSWQDKTAVACGVTGKTYTYAQLRDRSAAFAVNLQKFGLQKDDVVGICMHNTPEFMTAVLGSMEAGCIVTSFNPAYTADEIARQTEHSNAKLLICLVENYETVRKAVQITKRDIKIVCAKIDKGLPHPSGAISFYDWDDSLKANFSALRVYDSELDDTAFLPYSSGTTGMPKGVELSHRNILANGIMIQTNTGPFAEATTADFQEVMPCVLPLFHIYAFIAMFTSKLVLGCKTVTLPNFKPETFLNAMKDHKATILNLVPPLCLFLGQSDLVKPDHLATVKRILCGAAPLGEQDAQRVFDKAPHVRFGQGYGMTETCCVVLAPPLDSHILGSPGFPTLATQAKVIAPDDPEMKALGPNESGEILFRGPQMMKRYLNNKEATNETLVANKWLRTGDIGYYNDKGEFYITDRLKELIKVNAYQVAPAELEEVLRSHPMIAEAAVVGAPHSKTGEVPRAYVVPRKDKTVDTREVLGFLREKLAEFKIPDSIVVTDEIPKNASGKILRRQVKIKYGLL